MERVEQIEMVNNEEVNKIQDPMFRERFKKEWEEITTTLRQIQKADELKNNIPEKEEICRPTSSAITYK